MIGPPRGYSLSPRQTGLAAAGLPPSAAHGRGAAALRAVGPSASPSCPELSPRVSESLSLSFIFSILQGFLKWKAKAFPTGSGMCVPWGSPGAANQTEPGRAGGQAQVTRGRVGGWGVGFLTCRGHSLSVTPGPGSGTTALPGGHTLIPESPHMAEPHKCQYTECVLSP